MTIIDTPLDKIIFARDADGKLLNPRGEVTDTTDLQASMSITGQLQAITVIADGDQYLVDDGHRRVVAARILGWTHLRAEIVEGKDLLARMLGSHVRKSIKPTRMAQAIQKLAQDKRWSIERTAKLCGMKVDEAQLYIDLLSAPEAVQKRVDAGEIGLSTFKEIRTKPRAIQEQIAGMEKPTLRKVRQTLTEQGAIKPHADNQNGHHNSNGHVAPSSFMAETFAALDADHPTVTLLNEARRKIMADWHTLDLSEQTRIQGLIADLYEFTSQQERTTHGT